MFRVSGLGLWLRVQGLMKFTAEGIDVRMFSMASPLGVSSFLSVFTKVLYLFDIGVETYRTGTPYKHRYTYAQIMCFVR